MTSVILTLLMNVVIVVLLAVTIGYCWTLNRRIQILQDSRSELAQLLKHFDESTQRASESIIALQTASKKIGENIQMRIEKANHLIDELSFMLDRGNKLANQLEAGFAVSRAKERVAAENVVHTHVANEAPVAAKRVAEPEKPSVIKDHQKDRDKEKARSSLEAVLERLAVRNKPMVSHEDDEDDDLPRQVDKPRARSRSEQELLDMLKAGMRG